MKYSLAFTSLVSAGVLLGCSSEDSDPPPVAASMADPASSMGAGTANPGNIDPANAMGGIDPADSMGGAEPANPAVTPLGNEGQAGTTFNAGVGGGSPGSGAGGAAEPGDMSAAGAAGAPIPPPPPELDLTELVGPIDGHLFVVPCGDTPNTDDCNGFGWTSTFQDPGMNHVCVGNPARLDAVINFPVGGVPGTVYDVDMHFYGIMEPRQYANVTREAGGGSPSREAGGTPTPFATLNAGATNYLAGDNNYNTYELRVLNQNGQEVAAHFLNADATDGHYTLAIDYAKTLQLIGGGTLRLQIADANCRQIKNCGTNAGVPCTAKARSIDISEADPQPPANTLQQPGLGRDPEHSGQWFLIDVLGFAAAE
jgi:hypothetical protein